MTDQPTRNTGRKHLMNQGYEAAEKILQFSNEIFSTDGVKDKVSKILEESKNASNNLDKIKSFYDGDEDEIGFDDLKDELKEAGEVLKAVNKNNEEINEDLEKIKVLKELYESEVKKIEDIKIDLQKYKDEVVGGSLFKGYKERQDKADLSSNNYAKASILLLLASASLLFADYIFMLKSDIHTSSVLIPISIVLGIASFLCSSQSKIFRKLAEEYAHKTTLLQSFVGYRQQYKDLLNEEEYNEFFKEIMKAMRRNPSKEVDRFLHFKWPWEKAMETANAVTDAAMKVTSKTVGLVK